MHVKETLFGKAIKYSGYYLVLDFTKSFVRNFVHRRRAILDMNLHTINEEENMQVKYKIFLLFYYDLNNIQRIITIYYYG